jgi:hypothetical protein
MGVSVVGFRCLKCRICKNIFKYVYTLFLTQDCDPKCYFIVYEIQQKSYRVSQDCCITACVTCDNVASEQNAYVIENFKAECRYFGVQENLTSSTRGIE